MKEELEENFESSDLPAVIGALLDSLDDKNRDVKQSIIESIERISEKNPETVIHTAIYFWEMHKKISTEHMASLLNVMSTICRHSATSLNKDLAASLAEVAVNELKGETENEAAELLTELCKTYCIQAIGGLLSKLEPGIIPNAVIVSTIGKLVAANPYGMLSFIKIILTIIVPMLSQIREESLKQAVCFMTSKFCEAIHEYTINEEVLVPEINKQMFEEEICSICDFLMHNWLRTSRDFNSTHAILNALVYIITLLSEQENSERIIKLIPLCLNLSKKSNIRLASVKVLTVLLNCIKTESDKEAIRPSIEYMHQILFEYVSIRPYESYPRDAVLIHYEVLQCSKLLVILYPEEGLDRILQQLKSPSANQRARALVILKYLINTLPSKDDGTMQRIVLSLQESLTEDSSLQMVSAIAALVARSTFSLLPSQRVKFIRYMVLHCEAKDDNGKECSTALHLLATTVHGVESWLWPCLINALLDPACVSSVISLLRSLTPLAIKVIRNENSLTDKRDFPGTKILGRCLELLSDPANRFAVVTFLKAAAPLIGHQVKPYWDEKLSELSQECLQNEQTSHNSKEMKDPTQRDLIWEKEIVEWLEESVKLEGESWGNKIAEELFSKASIPNVALFLASACNNNAHISLLIELARSHSTTKEFARAVGICAKRHSIIVLKLMEEFCAIEDTRKVRVKLLGLMKDAKAAATAEAAKAGLLHSYAEIAQRGDPQKFFSAFETHVLPWTLKQLNECKELSTKEAGLSVLEEVSNAVHPTKFPEFKSLRIKTTALATLLGILQMSTGYKPLQLYPAILKAVNSLVCIPPMLNNEEREIFLSAILDKTISASSEIVHLNPEIMQQVTKELAAVSSEIVSDSADALAEVVDILFSWLQSKSNIERKTTLLVLHTVLQSYYNSLKYTYPSGKLDVGQLIGKVFCLCADDDDRLRPLVVDCLFLSLDIAARHRQILPENASNNDIEEIKRELTEDNELSYGIVKNLADVVSKKIPNSEIVGFAEGLIGGLLFNGDACLIAGIALMQHFKVRGSEISKSDVCLVDSIIMQMRQIENVRCRYTALIAISALMKHHPEEAGEYLLSQPLPLDPGTRSCWREIGNDDFLAGRALEILLVKLEFGNLFNEVTTSVNSGKNNTASLPSLAAIVGLKYLLESLNMKGFIEIQLPLLLSILLKYLSGWLHVETPASLINTKYGYVLNQAAQKMNPYAEVHCIIMNILMIIQPNIAYSLLVHAASSSDIQTEENVILIVQTSIKCMLNKNEDLLSMAQMLGKLVTSTIAIQRAVAATFYTELIGKVTCDVIRLETIINTLHKCKNDSSPLVRKHAIIGLARIAYLDPRLMNEYFDNCLDALFVGLEETAGGEGSAEVVLESLRGLSLLLSVQYKKPVSPRIVLALKPFIEKENFEMRFAAISALGAIATNWHRSVPLPNDDLIDHLLGCLPSLIIRLEDSHAMVVTTTQETLCKITTVLRNEKLSHVICNNLGPETKFDFEIFSKVFIDCLREEFPQRAEELRNAVVRGYSKSENDHIRATSALLLGLFNAPKPEDIQRLLQLLRDRKSIVRIRASQALSFCFTRG